MRKNYIKIFERLLNLEGNLFSINNEQIRIKELRESEEFSEEKDSTTTSNSPKIIKKLKISNNESLIQTVIDINEVNNSKLKNNVSKKKKFEVNVKEEEKLTEEENKNFNETKEKKINIKIEEEVEENVKNKIIPSSFDINSGNNNETSKIQNEFNPYFFLQYQTYLLLSRNLYQKNNITLSNEKLNSLNLENKSKLNKTQK